MSALKLFLPGRSISTACQCISGGFVAISQLVLHVIGCFNEKLAQHLQLIAAWGYGMVAEIRRKFTVLKLEDATKENKRLRRENQELAKKVNELEELRRQLFSLVGQNGLLKELFQNSVLEARSIAQETVAVQLSKNRISEEMNLLESLLFVAKTKIQTLSHENEEALKRVRLLESQIEMLTQEGTETAFKARWLNTQNEIAKALVQLMTVEMTADSKPLLNAQMLLESQLASSLDLINKTLEVRSDIALQDLAWTMRNLQQVLIISRLVLRASS